MIIAGPCLINDDEREIVNAIKTAEALKEIDPDIWFRTKIWGGGLTPEIYFPGIGINGISVLREIKNRGIIVGTEIQCESRIKLIQNTCDFIWLAARAMQAYGFLEAVGAYAKSFKRIIVKRHFGTTQEETWGIHDICWKRYGYKPIICERGVNVFDRNAWQKWIPDFRFMADTVRDRQDIDLMFDPSHASGNCKNIFPFVKAALAIGVKHYMIEVYHNPSLTRSDNDQAIGIEEFKKLHELIKKSEVQND